MPDPATLKAILGGGEIAIKLAKLAGLVESIEGKVGLLLETPLNAGLHMLEDARDSGSEQDRNKLVEAARTKFYEATQLEKSNPPRQVLALIALAACHAWLDTGNTANRDKALDKVLDMNPLAKAREVPRCAISVEEKAKKFAGALLNGTFLVIVILAIPAFAGILLKFAVGQGNTPPVVASPLMRLVIVVGFIIAGGAWAARNSPDAREALRIDLDVRKTTKLQLLVAGFLQKPVPWLLAARIEPGDRTLQNL